MISCRMAEPSHARERRWPVAAFTEDSPYGKMRRYGPTSAGHRRKSSAGHGMSHRKRSRKPPGHYCWACNCRRPNERFSGRGHARHLCRDCSKLGAHELAYRQALRNLERCMTWEGIIPRKRRTTFEQFLGHDDPRIRSLAEGMRKQDMAVGRH